ncbi:hypothetical protein HPB47_001637 [Ixodes persulcatus]|uniref:Uncharacterized protein n=1 Tax=Ixodes persulcatus TaxID=34615 RepID=A0AC60PNH6_IXOPE|nr:hypothetical protein HPB47_001637 [Ixodes persulcatus]
MREADKSLVRKKQVAVSETARAVTCFSRAEFQREHQLTEDKLEATLTSQEPPRQKKAIAARNKKNNHVYGVREENGTDIAAKCHSQQGKHVYDVTLQLTQDSRKVVAGSCTCRYGVLGECKHSAAVVHYINKHEVSACTSVPQAWGKPSKRPKLSDKASIADLFGGNRSNLVGKQEPREVPPRYIIDHFPDIDTPFTDILRLTGQNQVELECVQVLEDVVNDAVTIVKKSEVELVLQHLRHQASDGEALKDRLEVEALAPAALQQVTAENWSSYVHNAVRVEERMWANNGLADITMDRFIIEIGEDSSTDDSDDEEIGCEALEWQLNHGVSQHSMTTRRRTSCLLSLVCRRTCDSENSHNERAAVPYLCLLYLVLPKDLRLNEIGTTMLLARPV